MTRAAEWDEQDERRWEWMSDRMADLVADGAHGDDAYWQASGEWDDRNGEG